MIMEATEAVPARPMANARGRTKSLVPIVRPTIVAAVGGTGVAAAKHTIASMRELLERRDGFDFFAVRAFDTDAQDNREPRLMNNAQFVHLSNFNVRGVLDAINAKPEFAHWKEWMAPLLSAQQTSSGVGGVRPKGRLCYCYERKSVREAIEAAVAEVGKASDAREMNDKDGLIVDVTSGIDVHIISSVCGGTGSSMFLDLAYDVRSWLRAYTGGDVTVIGHLVLPGAFAGRPVLTSVLMANAYAALQELDRFMRSDKKDPWRMQYGQFDKVESSGPPFDYCYLLDGVGRGGLSDVDEITSVIGDAIAQMTVGAVGAKLKSQIRNLDTKLSRSDQKDRPCCYSSYGLVTIEVKNDVIVRQIVAPLVDAVIEKLTAPSGPLEGIDDRLKKLTEAFSPSAEDIIKKVVKPQLPGRVQIVEMDDVAPGSARVRLDEDARLFGPAFRAEELARLEPDLNRRGDVARALEADLKELLPTNGIKLCISYLARVLAWAQESLNTARGIQSLRDEKATKQNTAAAEESIQDSIRKVTETIFNETVSVMISRKVVDLESIVASIKELHQEWDEFSKVAEYSLIAAHRSDFMGSSRGGRVSAAKAEFFKAGLDKVKAVVADGVLQKLVPHLVTWRKATMPGMRDMIGRLTAEEWRDTNEGKYDCEDAFLDGSEYTPEERLTVILNSATPMWEIDEGYALADQRHEISAIGATVSSRVFQMLTLSDKKLQACDDQRQDLIPVFRTEHGISLMGLKRLAVYREPFIRTAIDEQRWDFHLFNDRRWISEMEFPDEPESYLKEYELFSKANMLEMVTREERRGYAWEEGVLKEREGVPRESARPLRSRREAFLYLRAQNQFDELEKKIEAKIRERVLAKEPSLKKSAGRDDAGREYGDHALNKAIELHIDRLRAKITKALEMYENGDRSVPEGILKADVSQIHTEIRAMRSLLKERGIGL
jgi:hypothetical protein